MCDSVQNKPKQKRPKVSKYLDTPLYYQNLDNLYTIGIQNCTKYIVYSRTMYISLHKVLPWIWSRWECLDSEFSSKLWITNRMIWSSTYQGN